MTETWTMVDYADNATDFSTPSMVEGVAHVIAVEGNTVVLEPEQSGSCGHCASASTCGTKGIGTSADKLQSRRFRIRNTDGLAVGERIVVGVPSDSLVKASFTAYILPLIAMLLAGMLAQWKFSSDLISLAASVAGLAAGMGISHIRAKRLHEQGELAPQYLRRARPGETCNS